MEKITLCRLTQSKKPAAEPLQTVTPPNTEIPEPLKLDLENLPCPSAVLLASLSPWLPKRPRQKKLEDEQFGKDQSPGCGEPEGGFPASFGCVQSKGPT